MENQGENQIGNWGKWGDEDERGALNYIRPDTVIQASKLVKKGEVYSLSLPLKPGSPVFSEGQRGSFMHFMRVDGGDWAAGARRIAGMEVSDDYILMAPHGTTHIDALCHVWFDDKLYNGFDGNTVRSTGARYCGIEKSKWIFTRGIMLDIPKFKGVEVLKSDCVINEEDLINCAEFQKIKIEIGDVLLVRTGWLNQYSKDRESWEKEQPGLGMSALSWIVNNEFCAVGSDNATLEVWPPEDKSKNIPLHGELLRNYGIYIMELLSLDELAEKKIYEFLFVATPLLIKGGTGSPLNPIAVV